MRTRAFAGIRHRAAKDAGVQILAGAGQTQLEIGDAFQAIGDRRLAGGELAGVANDDDVASQPLVILVDERVEIAALPTSSSPSITYLRFRGSRPAVLIQPSALLMCVNICPLSSVAPRAYRLPSRMVGSKGGEIHSPSGSGGCTS